MAQAVDRVNYHFVLYFIMESEDVHSVHGNFSCEEVCCNAENIPPSASVLFSLSPCLCLLRPLPSAPLALLVPLPSLYPEVGSETLSHFCQPTKSDHMKP